MGWWSSFPRQEILLDSVWSGRTTCRHFTCNFIFMGQIPFWWISCDRRNNLLVVFLKTYDDWKSLFGDTKTLKGWNILFFLSDEAESARNLFLVSKTSMKLLSVWESKQLKCAFHDSISLIFRILFYFYIDFKVCHRSNSGATGQQWQVKGGKHATYLTVQCNRLPYPRRNDQRTSPTSFTGNSIGDWEKAGHSDWFRNLLSLFVQNWNKIAPK